jgi:hypothetical protein
MSEDIKKLMRDALDQALKNQIMHLFEIWMKDDRDQPQRAANGVRQAIQAYQQAIAAIDSDEVKSS